MSREGMPDRFWSKVNKDGPVPENRPDLGPCWIWVGNVSRYTGYGQFTIRTRVNVGAHRVGYELLNGPIQSGLQIDHLCRVRSCVNPAHLEPVTRRENLMRGVSFSAINAAKVHCPKGHPLIDGNLSLSAFKKGMRTCLICGRERSRRWAKENPEKIRDSWSRFHDRLVK